MIGLVYAARAPLAQNHDAPAALSRVALPLLCLAIVILGGCSARRERDGSSSDGSVVGAEGVRDGSAVARDAAAVDGGGDGLSDAAAPDGEAPNSAADSGATSSGDASSADAGGAAAGDGRCAGGFTDGRMMECLDRGVFALTTETGAFVSWRLFGTDPADIAFHLYREADGTVARVCQRGPGSGNWCSDPAPPANATYFVRPVIAGVEGAASGSADLQPEDYLRIPLQPASSDAAVHLA